MVLSRIPQKMKCGVPVLTVSQHAKVPASYTLVQLQMIACKRVVEGQN